MEGETFINRVDQETEWIVQKIGLDAPVYDSYIKHIANDKLNTGLMLSLPYLYPGRYFTICVMRGKDGEMKTADTKIVLTTQQS